MTDLGITSTIILKKTPEILAVLNSLYNPKGKIPGDSVSFYDLFGA